MKPLYLTVFLLCHYLSVNAQHKPTLQEHPTNSLVEIGKVDPLDSLAIASIHLSDSLNHLAHRIDTIEHWTTLKVNAITTHYTDVPTVAQKKINSLETKIDSLGIHNPLLAKYIAKRDSSREQLWELKREVELKIDSIKTVAFRKIEEITLPPEMQPKVNRLKTSLDAKFTKQLNAISQPTGNLDKSASILPPNLAPNMSTLNQGEIPVSDFPNLVNTQSSVLDQPSDQIVDIKSNNIASVQDKINSQSSQMQNIQDFGEKSIDKAAENKLTSLDEVIEIRNKSQLENFDALKSEQAMKDKLKNQAQELAVDHFAAKDQKLQAAIDKISKYKPKYESLSEIGDAGNKLKSDKIERLLIDRMVPGIGIQPNRRENLFLVDLNPYVGLSITHLVTLGVGWNQRFAYNWDLRNMDSESRIFGPRIFGELKLGKGFNARAEGEIMNTEVSSIATVTGDPKIRQWVPGIFVGVQKNYTLLETVRGTVSLMTRVTNPKGQSPYGNVINVRFGFEFPLRKSRRNYSSN